jgi:hypothetical protein
MRINNDKECSLRRKFAIYDFCNLLCMDLKAPSTRPKVLCKRKKYSTNKSTNILIAQSREVFPFD